MRIALLSQFHPEIVSGGAERAAYSLFQNLRAHPAVEFAAFVAPVRPEEIGHAARFGAFRGRPHEIVASPPPIDPFTFESRNVDELSEILSTLVQYLKPDVVHVHHFLSWGIEIFEILARLDVPVVLTLHEFMLICNHYGQMITPQSRLCREASPVDCSRCFPKIAAGKFFIRSEIIKRALAEVDHFIAPSEFLARRFVEWGLADERVSVVENCVNASLLAAAGETARVRDAREKTIFGFFGNWNPFKGVDVLLEAYRSLPDEIRDRLELRLYGANEHWAGGKFDRRIRKLLTGVGRGVQANGSYRNEDTLRLMAGCDWVVVPSIWWENSPVVMQEAKLAGCRILCSDIGGMREKIDPEVDMTFSVGSAASLADAMQRASAMPPLSDPAGRQKQQSLLLREEREKVGKHLQHYTAPPNSERVRRVSPASRADPDYARLR